mmetsp:Transcript_44562/g.50365  ORF Transcript_44562/g.50365 Transcript_44562/m.50365 type:complete len:284 (-) Transcript_44562:164-1015(-)
MAVKFLLFSEILHLVVALLTLRRHDDGAVVAFQLVSNGNPRSAKSKSSVVTSRSKSSLNAVSSRRDVLTTASTAGMILVAGLLVPLDADNNKALAYLATGSANTFQGVYRDRKHPTGYRVLYEKDGTNKMILTDAPDGKVYTVPILVNSDKATGQVESLCIDFSVKGGKKDVVGAFNKEKYTATIDFPDNLWKKEDGVSGVYSDGINPTYRRIIRREKPNSSTLVLDLINKPGSDPVTVLGKEGVIKSDVVTFDFPGKPGDKGKVSSERGTISFSDGNVWTKI